MHIAALEAFDDGSHAGFLEGLIAHSGHTFLRMGLPGYKWKWRMHGAALWFARQLARRDASELQRIAAILTSDMTGVTDLKALLPEPLRDVPIVCYFHENQLTYPLQDESQRDYHYGFINISSALASDAVWFNSRYHRDSFLTAAAGLLARMPDHVPPGIVDDIAAKSIVMPLGLAGDIVSDAAPSSTAAAWPPCRTILWNHRWEFDKNPEAFFEALFDLKKGGIPFRVLLAGQRFEQSPAIFNAAKSVLGECCVDCGYIPDRAAYVAMLHTADIVVSTAIHEFFGLSVLEAVGAGNFPLLPNRLSYPELIPAACHGQCLYDTDAALRSKLAELLTAETLTVPAALHERITDLLWPNRIAAYDAAFASLR